MLRRLVRVLRRIRGEGTRALERAEVGLDASMGQAASAVIGIYRHATDRIYRETHGVTFSLPHRSEQQYWFADVLQRVAPAFLQVHALQLTRRRLGRLSEKHLATRGNPRDARCDVHRRAEPVSVGLRQRGETGEVSKQESVPLLAHRSQASQTTRACFIPGRGARLPRYAMS